MEPFLFHGFKNDNIDALLNVLECGYILSRKNLTSNGYVYKNDCNNIFNGNDWISLSQKSLIDNRLSHIYRSSYDEFIFNKICLVIDPMGLDLKYTNTIDWDNCYPDVLRELVNDDNTIRYSYYMDEVQVKHSLSKTKFLAIGYPIKSVRNTNKVIEDLNRIRESLLRVELNIPIVNSDIYTFADNRNEIAKTKLLFK